MLGIMLDGRDSNDEQNRHTVPAFIVVQCKGENIYLTNKCTNNYLIW